jgi:hypothetical protein
VEAVRTRRARVGARVGAALVAGATGAWLAADAGAWAWALAVPAALAFVLACLGAAPVWAPALLGGEYAGALEVAGHARADGRAAAVAVALVAVAELSSWSRELEPEIPHEPGLVGRRLLRIALLALGAGAVASAVLALAAEPLELGLAGDALGIAAAVAALALVAALARRHQH